MRHSNLMRTLMTIFFLAIMALATNAKSYQPKSAITMTR